MSENIETREGSVLGIQLGFTIESRDFNPSFLAIHLQSSIHHPYLQATVHINDVEGLTGYLDAIVRGADAAISFTGGDHYTEIFTLSFSIVDIILPMSSSPRTPIGDITLHLVPRWVYHSVDLETKIYAGVTDPASVLREEFEDLGITDELVGVQQMFTSYSAPRSFFRTGSSVDLINNKLMPWALSADGSPPFFYQRLANGTVNFQSAISMLQQPRVAELVPSNVVYSYSFEQGIPVYAFTGRAYSANPWGGDVEGVIIKSINPESGAYESALERGRLGVEGFSPEMERTFPPNSAMFYPGWRQEEERRAHAQHVRRHQMQRNTHVLAFEDMVVATVCDVGTRVRLHDFVVELSSQQPDTEDAESGEMITKSPMQGDYIVTASHLYYDAINEDGFTGSKIEVSKLGYTETELGSISNYRSFVAV